MPDANAVSIELRDGGVYLTGTDDALMCEWFMACDRSATGVHHHPILGAVPICGRCSATLEKLT